MKTAIIGNCTGDSNPDAWFPELTRGSPSDTKMLSLAIEVRRAIGECFTCPNQAGCLEEGMQPKNLSYGIWGGRLAGERILMADEQGIDYMVQGRTGGTRIPVGVMTDTERRTSRDFVVIKEDERVTVEAKRKALILLRNIRPWIERYYD